MKKIIGTPGSGKTTDLIKLSHETGYYIVCMEARNCTWIHRNALSLGLKIPFPLTFDEFISGRYYGKGIKGVLIDQADYLIGKISKVPVAVVTFTIDNPTIQEMEGKRMPWSEITFPEATPQSSIEKTKQEIKEIEENIANGVNDPEEYADAIMCLFDSAQRSGITVNEIMDAYAKKIEKNKGRKWIKNADNSYSHVK